MIDGNKALQPGFVGYRRPDGSIVEPGSANIDFELRMASFDHLVEARGRYRVHQGPTFTHGARTLPDGQGRGVLPSERRWLEMSCLRDVLRGIQQQVRAYNAAILPVDNGPEDRVAFAEATTRFIQSMDGIRLAPGEDTTEWRAALRAQGAALHSMFTTTRKD